MADNRSPDAASLHGRRVTRLARAGYMGLALFMGTVGVWAVAAPMTGAVIASATFVSEHRVRRVQHPTGGVVSALHVREGVRVNAGDVLMRLDETVARTSLQIVSWQLDEALARAARLAAERDRAPAVEFPAALTARAEEPEMRRLLAAEARILAARAATRDGARAQLIKRLGQLRSEIEALGIQERGKAREAALNARELEAVRPLFQRKLVPLTRLSVLEREAAQLETSRGALQAQIAQSEARLAETELQIAQVDDDWQREALRELRETEARIAELAERKAAAEDQHRRLDIRAPVDGVVHQLAVNSVGAVLNPAEPVLTLVPVSEDLHLEARVQPSDYDQIHLGQSAKVRIHAFDPRTTRELVGTVARVASDTTRDSPQGPAYYAVRISLQPEQLALIAPHRITSGMQADVFITTSARTPLAYLVQPFSNQIARAFRER
jgi:HlyD family secretion protein